MVPVHAAALVDREPLLNIVHKELKNVGLNPKLETPKPPKRSLVPFSTPGGGSTPAPPTGRIFGKRLTELSKLLVSLDPHTDVLVPKFLVSACGFIQENLNTEGIYRLAGSNARQKTIRRELECSEKDLYEVSPIPSVLDVTNLLKQFLRELPVPLLPLHFHSLLADALNKSESSLLLTLLLLPTEHLSCLSYLCRHLAEVAENSARNKMTVNNLAIVLTPCLFPIQDSYVAPGANKDRRFAEGEKKLKIHTAIVEAFITNSNQLGFLTGSVYDRYLAAVSQSSDDNLDEDCGPSKRKSKKRIRRRSGSLSRVLSVMGKGIRAMARTTTTPNKGQAGSIHSTPLPQFGATPDYPSPRGQPKRKAPEHELSPSTKSQKRGFESTFTPKMRTRSFSVKRFKRKKSEGKLPKETFVTHTKLSCTPHQRTPMSQTLPTAMPVPASISNLHITPLQLKPATIFPDTNPLYEANSQFENEYAEVKAQYQDLKEEVRMLEESRMEDSMLADDHEDIRFDNNVDALQIVEDRYEVAKANGGTLDKESRDTARQLARVKRRSSESKKPRSPSQRRIGVIRRKSKEREERLNRRPSPGQDVSPRERGRSPGPRRALNKSPVTKIPLTPLLNESGIKGKLLRGRPNTTTSGLEKPSPVSIVGPQGNIRIKNSFKSKDRGAIRAIAPASKIQSPVTRSISQSDSISSLRSYIHDIIEKSFSTGNVSEDNVFGSEDTPDGTFRQSSREDVQELSSQMENVSFNSDISSIPVDFMKQESPLTRSQLRRQSHSFEFTKPSANTETIRNKTDSMRRQSSAFEFRSKPIVEPIYENLSRDTATRASLRRRNSSVKDLIQKMEMEAQRRIGAPKGYFDAPRTRTQSIPENGNTIYEDVVLMVDEQSKPSEDIMPTISGKTDAPPQPEEDMFASPPPSEEMWVDGSEFFKNVQQANLPQCGRSSIVKIRTEHRGRVLNSVTKFSGPPGSTPVRRGATPGSRRISARMGVSASPSYPPPPVHRRQTLTGIRTSAGSRPSGHYTAPTISTLAKKRDKSPLAPPRPKRSPTVRTLERKKSDAKSGQKTTSVRRTSSNTAPPRKGSEGGRGRRRDDRRFLTIGYNEDVRSPLRECQNIHANVKRSNSDQTTTSKKEIRKPPVAEAENTYQNILVSRTHSLKSDLLMSPACPANLTPRAERVRRANSERTTPRHTPYKKPYSAYRPYRAELGDVGTPRRSPRLL